MFCTVEKEGGGKKSRTEEEERDGVEEKEVDENSREYDYRSIPGVASGWRAAPNTFLVKFQNSLKLVMGKQMKEKETEAETF